VSSSRRVPAASTTIADWKRSTLTALPVPRKVTRAYIATRILAEGAAVRQLPAT
jgi:hypothetical protein